MELLNMSLTAEFAGIDHDEAVDAYDRDGVIRIRGYARRWRRAHSPLSSDPLLREAYSRARPPT